MKRVKEVSAPSVFTKVTKGDTGVGGVRQEIEWSIAIRINELESALADVPAMQKELSYLKESLARLDQVFPQESIDPALIARAAQIDAETMS
jgi:hypothetical protein